MSDLVFYTNPMSRGRIVRWMLEEVGQPYETRVLRWETGDAKAAEYLAINPMGKVPAIVHDGVVVTECAAICAYLADVFPEVGLAPPAHSPLRGPYYRWLFFGAGPIEQAVAAKAVNLEPTTEQRRSLGFGCIEDVLGAVETAIKDRPYIVGDSFTAADLYLASHLSWGMTFGTIEKRPAFETYVARHVQRPAAERANEIDNALIPTEAQSMS
ncbi:glutathione S-transferase family protein [Caulobacter vibrioides]|uniref:glutathione S-transferase family protein n=1 Tax=Caulobacter vibrioides TaxID=155892 RepID=UPI000BB4833E|nr:glutathione S-transferase family protein [Caulobacter vibrioides]ATC23500.1 glutathione S-transferase family protein [Caulobacter vibrioides]PLR11913.1 glutathione S-transferase family protein [Caulobacter vibrioides]